MKRVLVVLAIVLAIAIIWFVVGRLNKRDAASGPTAASSKHGAGARGTTANGAEAEPPDWFGSKQLAPRKIAGRVTAAGKPVDGATVRLHSFVTRLGAAKVLERTTGADGRFDFGPQRVAAYDVAASATGYADAVLWSFDLHDPTLKPPADQLELRLERCEQKLTGTVADASGGPIVGARVYRDEIVGTTTNAKGEYELCVPRRRLNIKYSADGYGAVFMELFITGDLEQHVVLVPEASINAVVVRADTNEPVADAVVTVWPKLWGPERPAGGQALAGPDGHARITGLLPGAYHVYAWAKSLTTEAPVEAYAEIGSPAEVLLRLEELVSISGRVVRGDQPVAGAEVFANRAAPLSRSSTGISQADGSFSIDGAPIGDLTFTAFPFTVKSPTGLKAERGKSYTDVVIQVDAMATLHGRVTRLGQPVAGAQVCCINGSMRSQMVFSDADGKYEFKGVEAGTHVVGAQNDDAFVEGRKIVIEPGADKTEDFEMSLAGTITGTVVDKNGKPVKGVYVQWTHEKTGDLGRGTTDPHGRYRCGAMSGGGVYRAVVKPNASSPKPFPTADGKPFPTREVKDGSTLIENVTLAIDLQQLSISGRVIDTSGSGVPDVRVRAVALGEGPATFNPWSKLPSTFTETEGAFTVTGLMPGAYALQARAADGAEAVLARIEAGSSGATLTLQRPATIEGTLAGFSLPPVVYADPIGSTSSQFHSAQVEGNKYRVRGIPPGRYFVTAQNATEGDAKIVVVETGKTVQLDLTSAGRAAIEGKVLDFKTNAPVSGATCHVVMAIDGLHGITNWDPATAPKSGPDGRVMFDPAPAGSVGIECFFAGSMRSPPSADITVAAGSKVAVQLYTVEIDVVGEPGTSGIEVQTERYSRPEITSVSAAAAKAGLAPGDVIIAVDGVSVEKLNAVGVRFLVNARAVGKTVTITVVRAGAKKTATLTITPAS